ncbi:MAG TPA: 1-acyl-sn-glycerol-3-phosphate acyltransferase [Bdellovibrionales bacterium]|nr:1-acyl-sn-glycerol-3-phosphate acyltransferase [Bdellovibrionales bacterium]
MLKAAKTYYRAELSGFENIPPGPALLVGNHNAIAVVSPEIWLFGSRYFEEYDKLKVLGHDLVLRAPGAARFARSYLKYIPNSHASALRALAEGSHVLVYPGGAWESCRPSRERGRIDFAGRTGFVRLAREAGVPIVPVVATGAHDGVYVWRRGTRLARALGLKRWFRIDAFPVGLSFPLLFLIGPLFPFVPLPRKVILKVLPPVTLTHADAAGDARAAAAIVAAMQQVMNESAARRAPGS